MTPLIHTLSHKHLLTPIGSLAPFDAPQFDKPLSCDIVADVLEEHTASLSIIQNGPALETNPGDSNALLEYIQIKAATKADVRHSILYQCSTTEKEFL